MRLTQRPARRRSPGLRRAESSGGARLRPDAGGDAGESLVVAVLVLLSPAIYSYATWMLRPSSMPFFARSVEWVRADVALRQPAGR